MNTRAKTVIIILIIVSAFVARALILRGATYVSLAPGPVLSGAISQSLASSNQKTIPQPNKDYSIDGITFFDSNSWAVSSIFSGQGLQDKSFVVLQKVDGVYRVVLGPGTAFSSASTYSLPADVFLFLKNSGVLIYQPTGGQ